MERVAATMLIAGVLCFALAGIMSGYLPVSHLSEIPYKTLPEMEPNPSADFIDLSTRYPEAFARYYGEPTAEKFHEALRHGRDTYIAEACWHCHSQFVRPVSNENIRFGKVSYAAEYMNEMFLPHLFGTRRVGPDLIRESGRYGNDWHAAHFFDPTIVSPTSVMPRYTWFYDGEVPNYTGLAVITYVQWLGSWATPEALARKEGADAAATAAAATAAPAEAAQGFADVPIIVYFIVTAGWVFLLVWCFMTGKLKNVEGVKNDMLAQEEEYERQGI